MSYASNPPAAYLRDRSNYSPKKFTKWLDYNARELWKVLMPVVLSGGKTLNFEKGNPRMISRSDILSPKGIRSYDEAFPYNSDMLDSKYQKWESSGAPLPTDSNSPSLSSGDVLMIPEFKSGLAVSQEKTGGRSQIWDLTYTDKGKGRAIYKFYK